MGSRKVVFGLKIEFQFSEVHRTSAGDDITFCSRNGGKHSTSGKNIGFKNIAKYQEFSKSVNAIYQLGLEQLLSNYVRLSITWYWDHQLRTGVETSLSEGPVAV